MKYSPELQQKAVDYIRLGLLQQDAAELLGISAETFSVWKKEKPQFSQALKEAQLQGKARMLGLLQKHAEVNLNAVMFYLSRKYPQEWADSAGVMERLTAIEDKLHELTNPTKTS